MEFHCIDQLNWPRPLWTNQNSSPRNLHQGLRDSSLVWLRPREEKNVCWELWQPGSGMVGRLVYFKRRIEERSKNTVREKRQAQIPETQLVSKAWVHPLPWVSLTYLIPLKYTPSFYLTQEHYTTGKSESYTKDSLAKIINRQERNKLGHRKRSANNPGLPLVRKPPWRPDWRCGSSEAAYESQFCSSSVGWWE